MTDRRPASVNAFERALSMLHISDADHAEAPPT